MKLRIWGFWKKIEVAWQDVLIWNGSGKYCRKYREDTISCIDGQMDGWTDRKIIVNMYAFLYEASDL